MIVLTYRTTQLKKLGLPHGNRTPPTRLRRKNDHFFFSFEFFISAAG